MKALELPPARNVDYDIYDDGMAIRRADGGIAEADHTLSTSERV